MANRSRNENSGKVSASVRRQIEKCGERVWRLEDFGDMPFTAVAQALSRLTRSGFLQRLSKGVYYLPRATAFGQSRPNPTSMQKLAIRRKKVFPAGLAAANLLGFTTQSGKSGEVATSSLSLPRKLIGSDTTVYTRRPEAWAGLSDADAALLDFLRRRGETSELSPTKTVARLLELISERGRFERLLKVADTEPPRVRAMLGAIGQELGKRAKTLTPLRATLNSLTSFDFGVLTELKHAQEWQAKERRQRATV